MKATSQLVEKLIEKNEGDDYDIVHLGDKEYGNELMRKVAEEWFAAHSSCNFVEVYEHAGWFLGFRRDGSIWSTANDQAHMDSGPRPKDFSGTSVRR